MAMKGNFKEVSIQVHLYPKDSLFILVVIIVGAVMVIIGWVFWVDY